MRVLVAGLLASLTFAGLGVPVSAQYSVSQSTISIEEAIRRGKEAAARDDYLSAMSWYRRAGDQGDAFAQAAVGIIYLKGLGVDKDYAQALAWFRKAEKQGLALAQAQIGIMYIKGWGVKQDDAEAARWLRKAADKDLDTAQYLLGLMYQNGTGVGKDLAKAVFWLRKAADQGNTNAKASLDEMNAAAPPPTVNRVAPIPAGQI